MVARLKVQPINREIALMISETLSSKVRSQAIAQFARAEIDRASAINKQALGRVPDVTVTVNGRRGAALESANPDRGVIIAEFEVVFDTLLWINTQLQIHSPVRSGLYAKSHELFADGQHVENPNNAPPAD